jgi:hypothetical protein
VLPPALKPVEDLYLSKQNVPARVRDLAYRVTEGAKSDFEKATAIKMEIERRVMYNIRARRTPRDEDPVEYFLFESNEGYCDLFASSMAVMARSVGLPSRYVIGYIINDAQRDDDGFFTIRARDYHAWCEIYFEGVGWVPFDPTEGAESVGGAERGASEGAVAWYQTGLFKGVVVAVLLIALATPAYFALRQRSLTSSARDERSASDIARLHTMFYRTIERHLGSPKRFSQTTREFVHAAGGRLGPALGDATALVTEFESAMYSPRRPNRDAVSDLSRRIADLRANLGRLRRKGP